MKLHLLRGGARLGRASCCGVVREWTVGSLAGTVLAAVFALKASAEWLAEQDRA